MFRLIVHHLIFSKKSLIARVAGTELHSYDFPFPVFFSHLLHLAVLSKSNPPFILKRYIMIFSSFSVVSGRDDE
jgi:hypothetical protein